MGRLREELVRYLNFAFEVIKNAKAKLLEKFQSGFKKTLVVQEKRLKKKRKRVQLCPVLNNYSDLRTFLSGIDFLQTY